MGQGESFATFAHLRNRVPKGAFERLERHKWKHLRAVLRGLGGSNAPRLPGGRAGNCPLYRDGSLKITLAKLLKKLEAFVSEYGFTEDPLRQRKSIT